MSENHVDRHEEDQIPPKKDESIPPVNEEPIDRDKAKEIGEKILAEKEAPGQDPKVGETGRRHPIVAPGTGVEDTGATDGTTWRGADQLGGDYENHSRKQGIGYGRGTSEESRNDHMYNSTDDDH